MPGVKEVPLQELGRADGLVPARSFCPFVALSVSLRGNILDVHQISCLLGDRDKSCVPISEVFP